MEIQIRQETAARNHKRRSWTKDHHYFKYCKISALALLKMVMHARSGGNLEVMGWCWARWMVRPWSLWTALLYDEGTETRVNAQAAAATSRYMAAYIENAKQVGRPLKMQLAGIIATLAMAAGFLELMLVLRCSISSSGTICSSGNWPNKNNICRKVNLGAFRTYPKGYKPQMKDLLSTRPSHLIK